jgi:hypothetical protein
MTLNGVETASFLPAIQYEGIAQSTKTIGGIPAIWVPAGCVAG